MLAKVCCFLIFVSWFAVSLSQDVNYLSNDELRYFVKSLPKVTDLATVYNIGKSAEGEELNVIKLASPYVPVGTPHVKLIGNIRGDEPLGRYLLLQLVRYLIHQYEAGDREVRQILDTTYVHILPSMNPDGFRVAQEGVCKFGLGRKNKNGFDLTTNFPSALYPEDAAKWTQPETMAVMQWMHQVPFVLSASIQGGNLAVVYPYDAPFEKKKGAKEHKTEDDELFRAIATNYSESHRHMADMGECVSEVKGAHNGIVNGATWYPFTGSMQDYNYDFHGCLELTLLLSCCKYPGTHLLESHWDEHREPLLSFIKQSHLGVKGVVRNGSEPVTRVAVSVYGRVQKPTLTTELGEYWKMLYPGEYVLKFEKDGYKTITRRVTVPTWSSDNPVVLNINLAEMKSVDSVDDLEEGGQFDVLDPYVDPKAVEDYEKDWEAKKKLWEQGKYIWPDEGRNAGVAPSLTALSNCVILCVYLMRF